MLQQILKDMYIDPDVLDALNEEQKKILFLKMRQEQVRRWKECEEKLEKEGSAALKPKTRKGPAKNVSWRLGRDGDVQVDVIREEDEPRSSPLILPRLSEPKDSDLRSSTRERGVLRSSLVKQGTAERVQSGTEEPPPSGQSDIHLHFKGVPPASEPGRQALPSQVNSEDLKSDARCRPLQEQPGTARDAQPHGVSQEELKSLSTTGPGEEENDDDDEDDYDDDDDGNEGSSKPPASYRPHLRFAYTHSIADRLRRPRAPLGQAFGQLSTTETPRPMDSQEQDKGKDSRRVSTWRRAEPGGPGPVDGDAVVTRGRVAQLTKTFSVVGSSGAEPRAKPPVPVKPIHLRTSSSVKRSLR